MRDPWHAWRAQTAPGDFVERTVAAIARDRVARARTRRRRAAVLAMAAALVIAVGALGWAALPRSALTPRASTTMTLGASPRVEAIGARPARPSTPVEAPPGSSRPVEPPVATGFPPAPHRKTDVPIPSSGPPPSRAAPARLPRCSCVRGICDCGEEP
ncbi:MAG TPA: hypothetical protein VE987_12125 [Polyangiaceae bacterium]|nr:hypothetical protein [Polyangiaceae bacterium]